jgi:hypothetical protein
MPLFKPKVRMGTILALVATKSESVQTNWNTATAVIKDRKDKMSQITLSSTFLIK